MPNKAEVSRHVWYRPHANERSSEHEQPFDAVIAHVQVQPESAQDGPPVVTLSILNDMGYQSSKTNVILRPAYELTAEGEAGWMPFQVGQAKAADAAAQPNG